MSEVFSTVLGGLNSFGGGFGGLMNALTAPLSIFKMISGIQQQQKQKAMLDRQIYFAKHPEAVMNLAKADTQQLSSGLTTGVGNVVQGQLAERGLNQAPGIYGEVLAQALAPYQQQNQALGLQMALNQIGIPAETLGLQSRMPNSLGGLDQLFSLLGPQTGRWSGGMVGSTPDNALSQVSNMPQPSLTGDYMGPDVAPPDIFGSGGGGSMPNLFGLSGFGGS